MKSGIELIAEERERQISVEGWTPEHDDKHEGGTLARAGACYALSPGQVHLPCQINSSRGLDENSYVYSYSKAKPGQITWPWDHEWYKPGTDRIRALVKAGALIAAEIDRLQRKAFN